MAIVKLLDISLEHITTETNDKLVELDRDGAIYVVPHYYGFFVYVADYVEPETPADLKAVLEFARDKGCGWIKFDCDGEKYEQLPVYHWKPEDWKW